MYWIRCVLNARREVSALESFKSTDVFEPRTPTGIKSNFLFFGMRVRLFSANNNANNANLQTLKWGLSNYF